VARVTDAPRRAQRLDGPEKALGRATYGPDVVRPGMLHGRLLRSLVPHARIVSVDTSAAERLPGVRAVLSARDVPDVRFGGAVSDVPLFATRKVRYQGEPIAVVAAVAPEIAEQALSLIDVETDALPLVDDPEAAMLPDAPLVHEEWPSYAALPTIRREGNVCSHTSLERGDVDAAFAAADLVVDERYRVSMVHQGYLEPRAALAEALPGGRLTVWSTTQLPFLIRENLAAILDLPVARIRVIATAIGGGFGGKLRLLLEPYCALLAMRTGRPVRMVMSVEEELTADAPRAGAITDVRSAVSRDGRILGRDVRVIFDCGAYAGSAPGITSIAALTAAGPYAIPAIRVEAYGVYTNKANTGSYRAPGAPQVNFPIESHMDEIAARVGLDPLELRLRHVLRDGDVAANGQELRGVSIRRCLERAADAIGWGAPGEPASGPSRRRGKGLACAWWTTTQGASSAYTRANEDGSIVLVTGCAEIGTGAISAGLPRIVADRLGVRPSDVIIVSADTDATPYDLGAQGSRSLYMAGSAALRASEDLAEQLGRIAAEALEISPEDVELRGGAARVRGAPGRSVPIGDLVRLAMKKGGPPIGTGTLTGVLPAYDDRCLQHSTYPTFNDPSFTAHAAEVEVDTETGEVQVLRYVAAHDVGRVIDRGGIEGQVAGGVVQGLGQALMEEIAMDGGAVLNANLGGYRMPSSLNAPPVESVLVESPSEHGVLGVKGVGEPPVIPPAATIANAVRSATGARLRVLPMTPECVLDAIDAADRAGAGA
jgi:CO/xanthine dehydrogenase Mo-binding subunit